MTDEQRRRLEELRESHYAKTSAGKWAAHRRRMDAWSLENPGKRFPCVLEGPYSQRDIDRMDRQEEVSTFFVQVLDIFLGTSS